MNSPVAPMFGFPALFLFRADLGSFVNVCLARIPNHESIVYPPSHCQKCNAPISFFGATEGKVGTLR